MFSINLFLSNSIPTVSGYMLKTFSEFILIFTVELWGLIEIDFEIV